jgi:PPP family 3-phenylpropionic acid transporter
LTLIAAYQVPGAEADATLRVADKAQPVWKASEPRELLRQREFQLFLVAAGLAQAAHAAFFTFGTLLWQKQGLSAAWCGTLWAIGVFAEVLLFTFSGRVAAKFGAVRLIAIAGAASVVRWLALAAEPSLALLMPLQLLHGVTYGASHIGAMHFIHDAVPRDRAGSAQALYATVSAGVAMGVATLIAGYVYADAGPLAYVAMAAVAAVSLAAAMRLSQTWDGGELVLRSNA